MGWEAESAEEVAEEDLVPVAEAEADLEVLRVEVATVVGPEVAVDSTAAGDGFESCEL